MFVPVWFLLAWLGWALEEMVREPPLPGDGAHALPALCLAVALFLLYHGGVVALDLLSRRTGGATRQLLRLSLAGRPLLPLVFFFTLLWSGRWGAYVRFELAGTDLFLYCLFCIAPFVLLEALAVLGDILLTGRAGGALDRLRSTLLLAPVLFLVVGWTSILGLHPLTRAAIHELELARYAAWTVGFAAALVLLPNWFMILFRSHDVEPVGLRSDLEGLALHAAVGMRGIHVLETGLRSLNAAVLGVSRLTRRVFLTDLLVARFQAEETRAVFAHEVAHVQRHHGPRQILFFLVLPLLLIGAVLPLLPWSADQSLPIGFLALLAMMVPLFRWLRHRFEHEADLFGARLLGDVAPMIGALNEVEHLFPSRAQRSSLFHPSTRRRIDFLQLAAAEPLRLGAWFRTTLRVQALLFFVLGLSAAWLVPRLVERTRAAWPGFLLASGRPAQAYDALVARAGSADADVEHLRRDLDHAQRALQVAWDLDPGPGSVETLRRRAIRRARTALADGHWQAARGWYGVARRWGDCGEAVDAMSAFLDAESNNDVEGMRRANRLLQALPLPQEMKRAVVRLRLQFRG